MNLAEKEGQDNWNGLLFCETPYPALPPKGGRG